MAAPDCGISMYVRYQRNITALCAGTLTVVCASGFSSMVCVSPLNKSQADTTPLFILRKVKACAGMRMPTVASAAVKLHHTSTVSFPVVRRKAL